MLKSKPRPHEAINAPLDLEPGVYHLRETVDITKLGWQDVVRRAFVTRDHEAAGFPLGHTKGR